MMLFTHDSGRRLVLTRTVSGVFAALAAPRILLAQMPQTPQAPQPAQAAPQPNVPKRPDPLAPTLVREFVAKAHTDFAATKVLLAETPSLLNATWDWGGGDFETGMGGAGHMGHREIAEFLIGEGGRMDVFVAAMLGKLDIVKAMLAGYPNLLHAKGPHGIPLMAHAKKGGAAAEPVVAFLEAQGLKS